MFTDVIYAHQEALKMWRWLEEHPTQNKEAYVRHHIKEQETKDLLKNNYNCWLCTIEDGCCDCALAVADDGNIIKHSCEDRGEPYANWKSSKIHKDYAECAIYAGKVADKIQIWL